MGKRGPRSSMPDNFAEVWNQSESVKQVAEKLQVKEGTVRGWQRRLHNQGVIIKNYRKDKPIQRGVVYSAYIQGGLNVKEVAMKFRVSRQAVYEALNRAGYTKEGEKVNND